MTEQPPPPTPNVNVPPPPPRSGRSWTRWLLIGGGCLGKEAATSVTASMTLIDSEGRKSEADPDKCGYISNDGNIFLENVNPGVTDKGHTIFNVARDATGCKLELGDADLLSDEHGTMPLGI
jgi:hypothetical protein